MMGYLKFSSIENGFITYIRLESSRDHVSKGHLGTTSDALVHHLHGDDMVKTRVVRRSSHFGDRYRFPILLQRKTD